MEVVDDAAVAEAMKQTLLRITSLEPVQVVPYLTAVLQVSFHLLRDEGRQDTFVRGLLDGARAELEKPTFMSIKDLRVN